MSTPPPAERAEHVREHHGDRVEDPYAWMRDLEDPALLAHLEAENAYAEARTEHLAPLRSAIVEEIRSRIKETDLSVPVASGPWWYYARTVEGLQYAAQCARRSPTRPCGPSPEAEPCRGSRSRRRQRRGRGPASSSRSGRSRSAPTTGSVAFAVDTEGDERFDADAIRDIDTGEVARHAVTDIGYGVESARRDGRFVFYTRLDEAWRPFQLWRHEVGDARRGRRAGAPGGRRAVLDGRGRPAATSAGSCSGCGSKTTSEVHVLDADDPAGECAGAGPAPRGGRVRRRAGRRPVPHRPQHRHPRRRPRLGAVRRHEPRAVGAAGCGSAEGERFVGVDAFDDATVL